MSDTQKCPFCGSKAYDGDSGWFKCGTIHISEGNFAGTLNCKNLAEFREPFDSKIEQLERELNAANERIKQLKYDLYEIKVRERCAGCSADFRE